MCGVCYVTKVCVIYVMCMCVCMCMVYISRYDVSACCVCVCDVSIHGMSVCWVFALYCVCVVFTVCVLSVGML